MARRGGAVWAADGALLRGRVLPSLLAAFVGAALVRALTDLPPLAALAVGGIGGWLVAALALVPAAERLDRALHRMGGPRRRGR